MGFRAMALGRGTNGGSRTVVKGWLVALGMALATAGMPAEVFAYTGTFYAPGADSGKIYDLDKTGNGDSYLCWAYAFSCMVDWYQDMHVSVGKKPGDSEPVGMPAILSALKGLSGNVSGSFQKAADLYIQTGGYMLSYINGMAWRPNAPTAYRQFYHSSEPEMFSSLEGFSGLLLENLYRAPAFVDLLDATSASSGHAVAIWGAEYENGLVKAVYISDSDDRACRYAKYGVVIRNGRVFLDGYWAPRVNALTFLYAPDGVVCVPPGEEDQEASTSVVLPSGDGEGVTVKIPHSSAWMKTYMERHPDDYVARLGRDSDSDGFTDAEEYVTGTDPDDAAEHLRITGFSVDPEGRVTVSHEPAANEGVAEFTVEGATSPTGPWTVYDGVGANGDARFFRVTVKP